MSYLLDTCLISELIKRFENRILLFDSEAARKWGQIQGQAEQAGKTLSLIDRFIAAIAIVSDLTIATRNTSDMQASGARIFNPWLYKSEF